MKSEKQIIRVYREILRDKLMDCYGTGCDDWVLYVTYTGLTDYRHKNKTYQPMDTRQWLKLFSYGELKPFFDDVCLLSRYDLLKKNYSVWSDEDFMAVKNMAKKIIKSTFKLTPEGDEILVLDEAVVQLTKIPEQLLRAAAEWQKKS